MKIAYWVTLSSLFVFAPATVLAQRNITTDTTQDGGTFVVDPAGALTISDSVNNPSLTLKGGANTSGIQGLFIGLDNEEMGELLIQQSTLDNNGDGYLGYNSGSEGVGSLTGPGASLGNNTLYVGNSGTGTLTLEKGAAAGNFDGYIGHAVGSTGTANVTDNGSTWSNLGHLFVGNFGNGTLNIKNGGAVFSWNGSTLGTNSGSHGTAILDFGFWRTDTLAVGSSGTGTLVVKNSGNVISIGGSEIGFDIGSTGTATVTGPGSEWVNSGLVIGRSGTGTLNIEDGGIVDSFIGYLGMNSGSNGTATVTGAGTQWRNGSDLFIGSDVGGAGTLIVQDGGTVSVFGILNVTTKGVLTGDDGTIRGIVLNQGLIAPGSSPGILNIEGDLTSTGTVKFELAGTISGLFDQLFVSGSINFGGVIEVDLLNGFDPTAHDSFKLLAFDNFTDVGYTFDFTNAGLREGLSWDVSTFAVDGTIRVVPEVGSLMLTVVAIGTGLIGWRLKKQH